MLKRLSLLVLLLFGLGVQQTLAYDVSLDPYKDITHEDWATASIYRLSALGIISGFPDRTFREDDPLTREAFIKMLVLTGRGQHGVQRAMNLKDVDASRWSYSYIKTAYELGLIDFMIQEDRFAPESRITRGEVSILIGQYFMNLITEEDRQSWITSEWRTEEATRQFTDPIDLDPELLPYVYYASYRGIMIGDSSGAFRANDTLSRKEAAVIIDRTISEMSKDHPLESIGFYAIRSYQQIDKLDLLSSVIFGWSHLDYTEEGQASLNISSTEYRFPQGWEEVIARADQQQLHKELMVFADNSSSTLSRFLQDPLAQEAFIQSVKETLLGDGGDGQPIFTGLCIDFEGLKLVEEQELYVSFLRNLKSSIGDLSLSVTVPPIDYYKGYDLEGIGEIADQVIVMAYDYTHKDSHLPSAPLPLVNDAITTVLQAVPKDKVVLGISKQANQWIQSADGNTRLLNPAIELVEARMANPDSTIRFSYPYFLTNIRYNNQGDEHTIWYEDARSIEQKIWLARYYGLRGVSFWHIGNYTADDWKIIEQMHTD